MTDDDSMGEEIDLHLIGLGEFIDGYFCDSFEVYENYQNVRIIDEL